MKNCGVRKAHGLNFIRPKGEYLNYSLFTIHQRSAAARCKTGFRGSFDTGRL